VISEHLVAANLAGAVRRGDQLVVARGISAIECTSGSHPDLLPPEDYLTSPAHVIGLTGAPGVGKSTAIAELVRVWREADLTVAVVGVDPTSERTGGAVLGDRARMGKHADDSGVFIRSMAARGHLGGLSLAVPTTVQALMLAGYDRIVVETVGVGQSEIEVSAVADTTCVLLAPGMGDALQAIKAGVMEVGDVMVVTKNDLAGADDVSRGLRMAIGSGLTPEGWRVPIIGTSAVGGTGFEDVVAALDQHHEHVRLHGLRRGALRDRARRRMTEGAIQLLRSELSPEMLDALVDDYMDGAVSLQIAAQRLTESVRSGSTV
jgi:LAO/AO transport system kinase